jgi:UDP-galactopyranose mutase
MKPYDYLIVGAGLWGAVFAYKAKQSGKKCLVIDRRPYTGGNIYCENMEGINVHRYGPHIFHTSNKEVWEFVNSIVEFYPITYSPLANYQGKLYNLPFNMNTFYALWGIVSPEEAKIKIEEQKKQAHISIPHNLEEWAISHVGHDIYEKLIKGYTEKQWGRKCSELPTFIIQRLPVRFTFNNNYYHDIYQGIPKGGYNQLTSGLLKNIEVKCNTDFFLNRTYFESLANTIVFTGQIDEYYAFCYGNLSYRTLTFDTQILNCANFQGNACINYTEREIPYTRIIEHKHFEFVIQPYTVISKEYSSEYRRGDEPFYPVNDEHNSRLYKQYESLAKHENNVIFGGRLAQYRYLDMHNIIEDVLRMFPK